MSIQHLIVVPMIERDKDRVTNLVPIAHSTSIQPHIQINIYLIERMW
jgi:hypothetical protein